MSEVQGRPHYLGVCGVCGSRFLFAAAFYAHLVGCVPGPAVLPDRECADLADFLAAYGDPWTAHPEG